MRSSATRRPFSDGVSRSVTPRRRSRRALSERGAPTFTDGASSSAGAVPPPGGGGCPPPGVPGIVNVCEASAVAPRSSTARARTVRGPGSNVPLTDEPAPVRSYVPSPSMSQSIRSGSRSGSLADARNATGCPAAGAAVSRTTAIAGGVLKEPTVTTPRMPLPPWM